MYVRTGKRYFSSLCYNYNPTNEQQHTRAIILTENFHRFPLCATICVHLVSNKAKPHVVYYVVYYSFFSFFFFFLIDRGRDVIAHGSRKILDRPQRYRASLSRMHDRSAYGSETMRVVEAYCVAISDGIARQLILRVMFSPSVRFTRAKLQSDAESRLLLDAWTPPGKNFSMEKLHRGPRLAT